MGAQTLIERVDPRRADALRIEAAGVFDDSVSKKLGVALGVTPRRARQLKGGERTSAISRFFMVLASLAEAGLSPFPLATKVKIVALQSLILNMTDDQLVKRFFDLLEREADLEGTENKITAMFSRSGDLVALADATEKEASVAEELSAVARELAKRGIDPRTAKF
jgi:hypothetical protein